MYIIFEKKFFRKACRNYITSRLLWQNLPFSGKTHSKFSVVKAYSPVFLFDGKLQCDQLIFVKKWDQRSESE